MGKFVNLFKLVFGEYAGLLCVLSLGVYLARALGPEQYAIYLFVQLVVGYFEVFTRFQVEFSMVHNYENSTADKHSGYKIALFFNFIVALAVGFFLIVFGNLLSGKFDMLNGEYVIATIYFIYLFRMLNIVNVYASLIENKMYNYMILSHGQAILTLIFVIVYNFICDLSIGSLFAIMLFSFLLITIYGFIRAREYIVSPCNFRMEQLRSMLSCGFKYYINNLCVYSFNSLNVLYASVLNDRQAFAFLSVSRSNLDVAARVLPAQMNILRYVDKESRASSRASKTVASMLGYLFFGVMLAILIVPFLSDIVTFIYGSPYRPMVTYFYILMPGVLLYHSATFGATFMNMQNRQWGIIISLLFSIIVQFVLIESIPGNARSMAISYSIACAIYFIAVLILILIEIKKSAL